MALTINPGRVTVAGNPVAVAGGPWIFGPIPQPKIRVAHIQVATLESEDQWAGKAWTAT